MIEKLLMLNDVFKEICNYKFINSLSDKNLRNIKNGISLNDALFYKFLYAKHDITKDAVSDYINEYNKNHNINNTKFTTKAYESKERNIPTKFYSLMFTKIQKFYNEQINTERKNEQIYIAVDGSNSNNHKQEVMLNMGYYDIKNKIPINLTANGTENRNKEVKLLVEEIIKNPAEYQNVVLIGDRFYFTYDLMHKLNEKGIKFIIRTKGNATNIENASTKKLYTANKTKIEDISKNVRLVKCLNTYKKTVFDKHYKKSSGKTYELTVKNDCTLVTNLMDSDKYSDKMILDLYRSRWEIEIYFKFVKYNFKFQHMKEIQNEQYNRLYI